MITTPLSRLADILNVDIGSMNRADAQDAVCRAAIIELAVKNGQLDNLSGHLANVMNERDELKITAHALPSERGTNRYGVDVAYFRKTINRELNRPLDNLKPDELARVFMRLAMTADKSVISEPEFAPPSETEHD